MAQPTENSAYSQRPGETVPNISEKDRAKPSPLKVPSRLLMGPGPTNAHPRVLSAQSLPLLGHLHPPFLAIMNEIQQGLRYLFQTTSPYVLLVSGTGHAGMEAMIANCLEPGETIVVATSGIWGQRVCDLSERYGAKVVNLESPPAAAVKLEDIKASLEQHKPAALFLCQGESSTGVHQSLAGLGELCHQHGALLLVDTVCSLGGVPFFADEWAVDCMYSGSQKCAAPFFMSERAMKKLKGRKTKVATYMLDMNLVGDYWGWYGKRWYHHTGPISMWYGMREALAIVAEQGLDSMWKRHTQLGKYLWAGLSEIGLEPYVTDPADRLITVNTIRVPKDIDAVKLITFAMAKFSLEISAGLGPSAGQVWRVGLMGYNATAANIELVLTAFRQGLAEQGYSKSQPKTQNPQESRVDYP
ncbi:MAG: alanine-glyoxylate transaminase [Trebouxia sp. A1-2]|nr:MAG: alanine-glyoxylate transaminase [Trebouxia sp. A1-2]